jgi:hypothetical protein
VLLQQIGERLVGEFLEILHRLARQEVELVAGLFVAN